MPQVDKCSESSKSEEPASQSSEADSDDSDVNSNSLARADTLNDAELGDQQEPNDIMSLLSVTMEVEEPQPKRKKVNHSSNSLSKEKRKNTNKGECSTPPPRTATHECTFCEKTFRDRYHLTRHLFVHAGEKVPDCKLCKKPRDICGCEPYQPILEKPHKCDRCGKTFRDKYHLNRHVFVHTREKPFKCMFCEKCFSRKDKLTQHSLLHA